MEKMTPRDRLLTSLRGGRPDRVPLVLSGFHYPSPSENRDAPRPRSKLSGPGGPVPVEEREILDRIGEKVHFFKSVNSFVNRYLVTPPQRMRQVSREERDGEVIITSEIDTPKGKLWAVVGSNALTQTWWTHKYPVGSLEDIEKIRSVPWELPERLAPPDLSNLPPSFAERGVIHAGVSSPFVCVGGMMPYGYFLELCAAELDLIKELTAQCLERILSLLDVILSTRAVEYVWMGGCEWLTPPMGSPRLYEELVQGPEKKVIDRVHEGGALCHVHCHGKVRSTIESVIARGTDFFEPVEPPPDGNITFAEAKAASAGRMTLGGNIEARILEYEDADTVEQAVRSAFEGGKERMVLQTTAGPISRMSGRMLANYHRMIDVWEELSRI